jgi:predicted PurR-regulated permease PerM
MLKTSATVIALRFLQIIFFLSAILYFGRDILIPLLYGLFIAIILYPFCKKLEKHHWPKSLSITAGLLIVIAGFVLVCYLFIYQLNLLRNDLPAISQKIQPAVVQIQEWIRLNIGISGITQEHWWTKMQDSFENNISQIIQLSLTTALNSIMILLLIPVFAVLFLYERNSFVYFLTSIAGNRFSKSLHTILRDVIHTYSNFIRGMVVVYFIVGCLNTVGLLALGIPHALLFGMLTAIMTIIPYVGIFVSALIPVSIAWLSKDSMWYPGGVIAVFAIVQYLEANVIFPRVVGTKLKISTWAMLVAIIAGGLLWGVSGMILFIPLLGIFKIILDYIPEWGSIKFLLEREEAISIQKYFKNIS